MIPNDMAETERLYNQLNRAAAQEQNIHGGTPSEAFAAICLRGMRQAMDIVGFSTDTESALRDDYNADSIAAAMAEAAWFAMMMSFRVSDSQSDMLAQMADARRRIYAWACNFRRGIADTWQCQGCLRTFTHPGVAHSPCMP